MDTYNLFRKQLAPMKRLSEARLLWMVDTTPEGEVVEGVAMTSSPFQTYDSDEGPGSLGQLDAMHRFALRFQEALRG